MHATKLLNGFEGGYITTNDIQLADTLKKKRNFGIVGEAEVVTIGLNAKLNEIHAAAALASLDSQSEVISRNHERLIAYQLHLKGIPGLTLIPYQNESEQMNYEWVLLKIGHDFPLNRDLIVKLFQAEKAQAQPYYSPPPFICQDTARNL